MYVIRVHGSSSAPRPCGRGFQTLISRSTASSVKLHCLAPTYFTPEEGAALINDMPVYMENWIAARGMYRLSDLMQFATPYITRQQSKVRTEWVTTQGLQVRTQAQREIDVGRGHSVKAEALHDLNLYAEQPLDRSSNLFVPGDTLPATRPLPVAPPSQET